MKQKTKNNPELSSVILEKYDKTLANKLKHIYQISDLHIEDVMTKTQLSKLESNDSYLYIALHFPELIKEKRIYESKEIHSFFIQNRLLLIDKDKSSDFASFLKTNKLSESISNKAYFLELVDYIITKNYIQVKEFEERVQTLEERVLNNSQTKDFLNSLTIMQRNIIVLQKIVTPLSITLDDLHEKDMIKNDKKNARRLSDTKDKIKKILHELKNSFDRVNILSKANESMLIRSTNKTIKLLAVINILYLPAMLIVGFFGMNLNFGLQKSGYWALTLAIILIILTTITNYLYLKSKNLL